MNTKICKAFLYSGSDLTIADGLSVHHPTVKEILSLGDGMQCEEIYWTYVYTIATDPYHHMVWLDEKGIDYESVSPFDVFILRWIDAKEAYAKNKQLCDNSGYFPESMFVDALSFFLGKRKYDISTISNNKFCIVDLASPGWAFGVDVYKWLYHFIRLMNCMSDTGKIRPGSKSAKRILIEDMRDDLKRAQRKSEKGPNAFEMIGDSISATVYGGNGGITPFNFMDLHIYQLLCGATITHNQMRVHAMMNGIYTGMLGTSNLSESELCWTNV